MNIARLNVDMCNQHPVSPTIREKNCMVQLHYRMLNGQLLEERQKRETSILESIEKSLKKYTIYRHVPNRFLLTSDPY